MLFFLGLCCEVSFQPWHWSLWSTNYPLVDIIHCHYIRGAETRFPVVLGLEDLQDQLLTGDTSTPAKLVFILRHLGQAHMLTLTIGLTSLCGLVLYRSVRPLIAKRFPWIRLVPEILLVVITATVLSSHFQWHEKGLDVLGFVSPSHIKMRFPIHKNWRYFGSTLPTSCLISALGYVDSVLAAKENSSRFNYTLSPNRELVALGSSNVAASFVSGTIP